MQKETIATSQSWHSLEVKEILNTLNTNAVKGLSENIASERLEQYGENVLPEKKQESKLVRFFKHFNDILIYILLIAAVVTALLGHWVDTIVILIVAIVNASIGYFQENKAEKALEDIKKMLSHTAQIVRDGKRLEIGASHLAIGDLVLLHPGDKIPADLRLIKADNLRIEESALTGESVPSQKGINEIPAETPLGDRSNMAFSTTTVSAGTGLGIVVATGQNTEIGKINRMMSEVKQITTPLLRQTTAFGKSVSIVIILIAILVFAFGYFFRNYNTGELLMSVIGLAIAAIPEGLPAILSIILAIGVQNMANRKAIVRTLPSVETLGSVAVICSDKTGTLTKNEMTVKGLVTSDALFSVTGTGYSPSGDIMKTDRKADFSSEPVLDQLIGCFYICNEASLGKDDDNNWYIKGDPTEGALITLYEKAPVDHHETDRLTTIPFDSEYKYMATLVEADNNNIIYIKGAPDRLLDMANRELTLDGEKPFEQEKWENKITELAGKGQRVIGGAYKIVSKDKRDLHHEDLHEGITFLGLAGIIDPPREEAIEAIKQCAQAGITVKMITGDHIETAKSIGLEMGIGDGINALEGKSIEQMTDEELETAAVEYDIFARTSPEHKLRLVKALQARNIICAMTGDGVNDAPALKKADVGIAMGIKGTEVTKDAAEMVLADDNFSTIAAAVEEGRRVYDNLKKTILFILPTNGAESFLIIASILFGTLMPLTPIQILWVNMVTSVTISLALAFEKLEPETMKQPPRSPETPLLDGYFIWRILFVSILIGGGTLLLNLWLLGNGVNEEIVRTITIQTIVITQMFHLFNSRSIRKSAFSNDFFGNKAVFVVSGLLILLQLSLTYIPFMNHIFGTVQLPLHFWIYPFVFGFAIFIIVEIEKFIMRRIDAITNK
ncbi:cation-transporting P-type ATPase [Dysgonomonas macrotermitis]|uniref:Plasma-membrane calcium-translocating P-type ATPase/potassium and/or sodium efflux P-type ATPase,TIGR01523 n=1 Tax=Dysgonomonas macrotermitis TaxID=1346286 RepID=A0A1M5IMA5_9BACT|nr:cation-transporting P-type ATPase [Dysgonomonas macrotermitis]SHG29432.1 plasma-membrane calcium-translocating P-type ATPase/potassium and/or sodium efflux P-type ATPase,TIGR01523 [Dysgonomonas macrotermitis]